MDQTSEMIELVGMLYRRWVRTVPTNLCRVVGGAKDELGCAVVSRTDVRDIGLVLNEYLGAAKITELQDAAARVKEQILWLDVSVADALRVDVGERAEELVDVELDLEYGHRGLHLIEIPRGAIDGLWHELEDEIEIDFILLQVVSRAGAKRWQGRHTRSPLE